MPTSSGWIAASTGRPPDRFALMFCSHCGERLPHLPPVVCPSCSVPHWNDAKPCGCALVTHEGRLLLVRRSVEPWAGHWDIPGGFCDEREHPIATAEREVLEETGVEVRVTGMLGMWFADYPDPVLGRKATLGIYYHAVPTGGVRALETTDEASEVRWFSFDEIPTDVAFPEQELPVLEAWRHALRAGTLESPLLDRPS